MSRANYRRGVQTNAQLLKTKMRRAQTQVQPRQPVAPQATLAPQGTVGSVGPPAVTGLSRAAQNTQAQQALVQTPAAGRAVNPVAPVNPVQAQPAPGGTIGKTLAGSTGFRARRR